MRNDVLMPKLGLTMTEGTLAEWAVKIGDRIKQGDLMFVVETDKVATEITAPSDGEFLEILVAQGDTVPVGTVVGRWTGGGQATVQDFNDIDASVSNSPASEQTTQAQSKDSSLAGRGFAVTESEQSAATRVISTPLARKLARQGDVDIGVIQGSGPRGRVKAQDVREFLTLRAGASRRDAPVASDSVGFSLSSASTVVQTMARRMVQAKQDVPHFYLATEANVTELLALRERLNASDHGVRLTLNHFLIAAIAHALTRCPWQNRIWTERGIVQMHTPEIGVAVSTERGLMAPVLKGLQGQGMDQIAMRANELVGRVRDGSVRRDDMQGGAITLSNAGMFNVTYMTPIINPPQSAILGAGSVRGVFRPDAHGQPVLQQEMGLVLAADHRLHDGASGLKFLNVVVDLLQDPYRLLRSV